MSRQDRNQARAIQLAAAGMRAQVPDSTIVNVVGKNAEGWYLVRKPHWPGETTMAVPVVPPGAPMPYPRNQVRMLFEDSNPQRPFLYWPWARRRRLAKTSVSVAVARWLCRLADFVRSNSQSGYNFDTGTLAAATMPSGGRFHRFLREYRVRDTGTGLSIPETPGENTPRAAWAYDGTDAQLALGLSNGAFESGWESSYPLEPGQSREHAISLYSQLSLAIVDDRVLVEVGYEIETSTTTEVDDGEGGTYEETNFEYTTVAVLFVLGADPTGSSVEMVYYKNLSNFGLTRVGDVVVTGGRVAVFFEGPYLWHFDFSDGSDLQELDLSALDNSNGISLTAANAIEGFMPSAIGDSRLWFGGGATEVCCANLATNALVWSVGGDTVDDTYTAYHPIGICPEAGTLVCVRETTHHETITDYELSLPTEYSWVEAPEPVAVPRNPEQARGHSRRAGIACLSLTTGEEVGYTEFSGTEADGHLVDSLTDYYTDTAVESWTHPANPINPDTDPPHYPGPFPYDRGRGYNEVPRLVFAGDVFFGTTPEREPGDNVSGSYVESETGSSSVAGTLDHLCLSGSVSQFYNTYTGPGIYTWETEYFNNVVLPQIQARFTPPSGSPADQLSSTLSSLIGIEESRSTNGDWIRAEAYRVQTSTILTFANSASSIIGTINGSSEFQKILTYTSRRERGLSYGPGYNYLGGTFLDAGGFIPVDSAKLDHGDLEEIGASVEYYAAQIAYNATDGSGDKPFWGTSSADFVGPSTGGGHTADVTHRAIWRPVGVQHDRLRTVRPLFSWDKAPLVNGRRILCPLYEAGGSEPLRWAAVHPTTGSLIWTAELGHSGWYTQGSIGVGNSVLTAYNLGGLHYLAEVDTVTGTVISDQAIPDNQPITDLMFGDGVLWPPSQEYGISSVSA